MRCKRIVLCVLATACVCGEVVAQDATSSPMFQQWIVNHTKFSFAGGRIVANYGAWMFGPQQITMDGPIREQINFNGNGMGGSLAYTYVRKAKTGDPQSDSREELGVEISSEGRFVLRYSDKDHPGRYFNLTQVPGQPISLSLPPPDKPHVLRAPTIWHLLIIDGEDCRKQLLPMLEAIHSGWHVSLSAQAAEDELVKMSAVSRKSDRKQWEAWVDQLADPHWKPREDADRNLREVGPAVLGYLNRLNMSRLDAEQQSRIHRIIRWLSTQTAEDTPEHVASMLIEDPLVWLALLARPEEPTRRAAVQQLTVLLSVPIAIDPKADPVSQVKAREALRKQIEKLGGEVSKPDDQPRPVDEKGKTSNPPPTR